MKPSSASKIADALECYRMKSERQREHCKKKSCPYNNNDPEHGCWCCSNSLLYDAVALVKEQEARIKKYEYLLDFLGIGFREWVTKIIDGEAEAICEADEHEHKTVITFKLI